jgi:hypothetical protein
MSTDKLVFAITATQAENVDSSFGKVARELQAYATKLRPRVQRWNYAEAGLFLFLPGVYLVRDLSPYAPFKYRLGVQFGLWGVDVGFIKPKKVDMGLWTEDFDPNEANERP